ncbi:uncharacterized protein L201_004726 [Kwoniella dendrophila CBS 6074]|uniref:MADS-box domain-containing protein n=1 Tax=Kwoniella dendrophila CBS 6074 TaxID=1295534 RepID=A0AAX4JWH8_9TREE
MGRKKIEIRPLVDERNRNVTFLKRKAGLMKKAWELSVLCGADVNIIIFNAAGKAYEFSSKELDEELDRYMDYEGMIERRRAPEFAAMALAGEDEEDDIEDEISSNRRGSTSKAGTSATANANGAPPRSLKGKESFKARYSKSSEKGKSKSFKNKNGGGNGKRRKKRSESEKRGFIDGILSSSSSDSSSDEDQPDTANARKRRKEKERARRERKRNTGGMPEDDRLYHHHDKNAAALQYAMNMHSSHVHGHGHHQAIQQDPRFHQHLHAHGSGRDRYNDLGNNESRHLNQIPVDIPQLPKLPSDGAAYRTSITSGIGGASIPQSAYYGSSSINPGSNQYVPSQSIYQGINGSGQSYIPSTGISQSSDSMLSSSHSQQYISPSQNGLTSSAGMAGPGGIQWNENLIAKYAEFQLQQNHQRQQRLLLERQRYQLQQMGVPVDERSLLDEIFGGGGNGNDQSQNQNQSSSSMSNHHTEGESFNGNGNNNAAGNMMLSIDDSASNSNSGGGGGGQQSDFVWPLSADRSSSQHQHQHHQHNHDTPTTEDSHPFNGLIQPQQQSSNRSGNIPDDSVQWGVQDGYTVDRDDLNLPSPISNGQGQVHNEGKRKIRREDNADLNISGKRVRM